MKIAIQRLQDGKLSNAGDKVIAGDVLYNVRKIESVNNAIWVKDAPLSPYYPQVFIYLLYCLKGLKVLLGRYQLRVEASAKCR